MRVKYEIMSKNIMAYPAKKHPKIFCLINIWIVVFWTALGLTCLLFTFIVKNVKNIDTHICDGTFLKNSWQLVAANHLVEKPQSEMSEKVLIMSLHKPMILTFIITPMVICLFYILALVLYWFFYGSSK